MSDVAVTDGVIVEVGRSVGRGRREIDVDGAVVTPGFVDIHTHYDGQATWDDSLAPSSSHGVTTVVAGNCGVGFAPVHETDRDQLVSLMEGVEDLPGDRPARGPCVGLAVVPRLPRPPRGAALGHRPRHAGRAQSDSLACDGSAGRR